MRTDTAKYWMQYIQLVNLYLVFNRACRTNDYDLFVHGLGEMCPHLFAGNRLNYARWIVLHYFNLLNIDANNPEAREMLVNGVLSIRRTEKSFSRTAVDMTLEQTVNKDTASRLTGISAFALSPSARTKWAVTKTASSAIVGSLVRSWIVTTGGHHFRTQATKNRKRQSRPSKADHTNM